MAKVGCGPTSLAMILDSLLGTQNGVEGLINEIGSKYYVNGSGSSWALFNTFPKSKGLNVNTIHNHDAQSIVNALSAGHPIAMSCKKGDFTNGGHFIVLTGIDANGMITVNDPNSAKRSAQK
ncbi:MAG: C39 family peptidase [Clostridia bacterium]|nr:C39 family peptidase [Clostridia bacterium]